jgi:hypothetical protein
MAVRTRLGLLLAALILISSIGWHASYAQSSDEQYFPETGHWVRGEFYDAYYRATDPLQIYGYPLTDAFLSNTSEEQLLVQYFQKARFELRPEAPPSQRVQLTPVGLELYTPGAPLPVSGNSPACRAFPEIGYQVCYAFLDFFESHGGSVQFGLPISDFEIQDELIIQYFEKARFEWHPENPSGQRVVVTNLGSQYFYAKGENPARLFATGDQGIEGIVNLQVSAFPQNAVMGSNEILAQTIYIIVRDQKSMPVPGAQVTLVLLLPSGEEMRFIVPETTNQDGVTQYQFSFDGRTLGSAQVQVSVNYDNLENTTSTSFRIWW